MRQFVDPCQSDLLLPVTASAVQIRSQIAQSVGQEVVDSATRNRSYPVAVSETFVPMKGGRARGSGKGKGQKHGQDPREC